MDTGEREAERPTSVGNGSAICRRSLERCKSGMKFRVRSEIVPVQDSCWSTITQNSGPGSHGSQIAWILRLCFLFNGSGASGPVNGHPGRWGAARCAAQVQLRDARMRFPDPRALNTVLRIMYRGLTRKNPEKTNHEKSHKPSNGAGLRAIKLSQDAG